NYKETCSYCMKPVGKAKVRKCSVCNFVRYCSRDCQKAAWKTHKKVCTSGGAFKDSLEQPGQRESKKLNDDFTKWLNYYRRLIYTVTAVFAFNLPNSPPNKLATHCMYIVCERRPSGTSPEFYFRMVSGQIITREAMVGILNNMDLTPEQVDEWASDNRGDHTVHIVFQFEDMLRFLWFSLGTLEPYKAVGKAEANLVAAQWADKLAGAIEMG
ncbi:hypothetical protein FOMPIDRAFT_36993, partial [Fomitopsis schrenkii]